MAILGTEWIRIEPETSGFVSKMKASLTGEGAGFKGIGEAFGGAIVVGVGVALFEIGEKFQKARHTITQETGLTGKAMEAQFKSVQKVFGQTPAKLEDVTKAMDLLRQRTGLTGAPLEKLGKQQIYLAKISGADLISTITTGTALMNKYGITAKDQAPKFDVLFKAHQQTGVGIETIMGLMTQGGSALQAFGLGFDGSAALVAKFSQTLGTNAPRALTALNSAFSKIAKAGGDPHAVLLHLIHDFQGGAPHAKAMAEAVSLLGARGGLEFATAIGKGAFAIGDLTKKITDGKGGISATGEATNSLGEKFKILKNKVINALEPIATKVVDLVEKGFDKVSQWFDVNGSKIGPMLDKWKGPIIAVAIALGLLIAPFSTIALGLAYLYTRSEAFRNVVSALGDMIQTKLIPAIQAIGQWIMGTAVPALQQFADFMVNKVWPVVQQVAGYIIGQFQNLVGAVQSRWNDIKAAISNVLAAIKIAVEIYLAPIFIAWKLFHNQIMAVVSTVWTLIKAIIQNALQVVQGVIDIVLGVLSGHWSRAWNGIKEVFGGVWNLIVAIVKGAIGLVWQVIQAGLILAGTVAKKGLDALLGFFSGIGTKIIDAFKGAGSWLKDVGKQIVQGLIDGINSMLGQLAQAIFNLQSKIPGSGLLSKLPGGSHFGRAAGGPVMAGHPYIVGEVGPELFVPSGSGTIVPHNRLGGAHSGIGGGTVVNITLAPTFPPGMDAATALAHMQAFTVETIAKTFEDVAANGRVGSGRNR